VLETSLYTFANSVDPDQRATLRSPLIRDLLCLSYMIIMGISPKLFTYIGHMTKLEQFILKFGTSTTTIECVNRDILFVTISLNRSNKTYKKQK